MCGTCHSPSPLIDPVYKSFTAGAQASMLYSHVLLLRFPPYAAFLICRVCMITLLGIAPHVNARQMREIIPPLRLIDVALDALCLISYV